VWDRRVRNEARSDALRVAAYEEFNDANEVFKTLLSAFQHNRNKHVDSVATPHHKRGGASSGGGGFDPNTFGALNRVATALESLVDLGTFVSNEPATALCRMQYTLH
jgi:hypothetical protein